MVQAFFLRFHTSVIFSKSKSLIFLLLMPYLAKAYEHTFYLNCPQERIEQELIESFGQEYVLKDITFESDTFLSPEEFEHLTVLYKGMRIDKQALCAALNRIAQKAKFDALTLNASGPHDELCIHFKFHGIWTFSRFKLHGIFSGKEIYRQLYTLESGEPFDEARHNACICAIKDKLRANGYYNCTITPQINRNDVNRTVVVKCGLACGPRFHVGKVTFNVQSEQSAEECENLREIIVKKYERQLHGTNYDKEEINVITRAIKEFLLQNGYPSLDITLEEHINRTECIVDLVFSLELNHKRSFVFFGNDFFSSDQLFEQILKFGKSAWLLPPSLLAEEIIGAYRKYGFWQIEVSSRDEGARYFFLLKEGMRARIDGIRIQGVQACDGQRIIKSCCRDISGCVFYKEELLRNALDKITDYYLDRGFLDVKIAHYDFIPMEENPNHYILTILIEEGARSHIAAIQIVNFPDLECLWPYKKYCEGGTIPFKPALLSEQRRWLINHFRSQGYLHAVAKPEVKRQEDGAVAIQWHVEPGQHVHFGKTIILGSDSFPFECIMRELQYQEGDIWDQEKIKQTFLRLRDLEIFESVSIAPQQTNSDDLFQTVIIKLQRDETFEVRVRAGLELQHIQKYQTFGGITYKVGGTFILKNPTNVADQCSIDLDFARSHREIVGKYRRPWFCGIPARITFQAYSIYYNQPAFVGDYNNLYSLTQQGFLIALSKKTPHQEFGLSSGVEWMETKITQCDDARRLCIERIARAIDFDTRLLDRMIPYIFFEPVAFFDYLDNKLNTTQGTFTVVSAKGMFPLSKAQIKSFFIKFLLEHSWFIPLGPMVAAFRARVGHIFHKNFDTIMPGERFYLGGSHSLRGYDADLAPPLGVFFNECDKKQVVPQGGKSMINANIELRFPVFRRIWGVVFQDFGALSSNDFADFNPKNLLGSTGFGIRFRTPVGPLRFDIGWKWHRSSKIFERSYAWFLTFGQAF